MKKVYEMFCPEWVAPLLVNVDVNFASKCGKCETLGFKKIYFHTTEGKMGPGLECNMFKSGIQALFYKAVHHHFKLSAATLSSMDDEEWLKANTTQCKNGYASSMRTEDLQINDGRVVEESVLSWQSGLTVCTAWS
eukprot:5523197-Amphidinium_carterae.1